MHGPRGWEQSWWHLWDDLRRFQPLYHCDPCHSLSVWPCPVLPVRLGCRTPSAACFQMFTDAFCSKARTDGCKQLSVSELAQLSCEAVTDPCVLLGWGRWKIP